MLKQVSDIALKSLATISWSPKFQFSKILKDICRDTSYATICEGQPSSHKLYLIKATIINIGMGEMSAMKVRVDSTKAIVIKKIFIDENLVEFERNFLMII